MSTKAPIRLFIVEDDEDDFFLLESSLKRTTFDKEITWAKTFDQAVKLIHPDKYDLAIIDYRLGAHTGIELIRFIRDRFPFLPTILLTGVKESTIDEEALQSGAHDYLAKDQYSPESIGRSIRYAIEKSKGLKSLMESENRFKNLFENAVEYVFLVDRDMRIVDANKAALRLFNVEQKNEVAGLKIDGFIKKRESLHESQNTGVEVEFLIPQLEKIRTCILNVTVADSEKEMNQWVFHDITERIQNEAREKMLEKQALTGKFARTIGHEIKNPLTNIGLSIVELREILRNLKVESADHDPFEFLSIIERNSQRINTLIEDLLNATRFDTMNLAEHPLNELLSETVSLIRDRAKLKEISIENNTHGDYIIKADREKMVIALSNVLVNAVEAVQDKKGRLSITTTYSNGMVAITVTDNGRGIPQHQLPNLFEPFFTSKKGGTGLGLTATYNIVTKHDGLIRVISEEGKGTSFIISLPAVHYGAV